MKDRAVLRKDGWHYYVSGKEVSRKTYEAIYPEPEAVEGGVFGAPALTGYPIHSEALAYSKRQIPEAREFFEKRGVPTDIDAQGRPVLRDRAHRDKVLKALGVHDNNCYDR